VALARLENLRSLCVSANPEAHTMGGGWNWLCAISEKGRLEHLHIKGSELLAELGCTIINQCRRVGELQ